MCKLIEGITSEPLRLRKGQEDDAPLGRSTVHLRTTVGALDLSDDDFPLVCTFEDFLELLENTVRCDHETTRVFSGFPMLANAWTLFDLGQ